MIAITGVTGNIGSQLAQNLLAAGQSVRAIVRETRKGQPWAQLGCEVAVADINNAQSMADAFQGAEGVFIFVPPVFDPQPGFPEAHAIAANFQFALNSARPARTVYLSTIGAQAVQTNLLTQHTIIENELRKLPIPITFLRPGWFMENSSWDVASARDNGQIHSFLQPLDKPVPMVATADIAHVAAQLFLEEKEPATHRIVELEGPTRVTPNEIAETFSLLLGHLVAVDAVPRETWQSLFESQGMKNPTPRIQMLDGFNQGWIEFESHRSQILKGSVPLKTVLKSLLDRATN
jgi:NAD(P)H dehydrogenase (quinone)